MLVVPVIVSGLASVKCVGITVAIGESGRYAICIVACCFVPVLFSSTVVMGLGISEAMMFF